MIKKIFPVVLSKKGRLPHHFKTLLSIENSKSLHKTLKRIATKLVYLRLLEITNIDFLLRGVKKK